MFGIISSIKSVAGQREALVAILVEGASAMPGCSSYVVATDALDPETIWVTEVWENREQHRASLSLPAVQRAIAKGRPLIAGFGKRHETEPVGGHGLAGAQN